METDENSAVRVSIIIPVLNEQNYINSAINDICRNNPDGNYEIIVVDGDSHGSTIKVIEDRKATSITSEKGRSIQMNAGAAEAKGKILLFLHADTKLPPDGLSKVIEAMEKFDAGAFDLDVDTDNVALKYIIAVARARSRFSRIPYGDQAIFLRKSYFDKLGGYKKIPLMEDVDLMRRIKKDGGRIGVLEDRIKTSTRRWEVEGIFYTTVRDLVLIGLYYLGVSPFKLSKIYKVCSGNGEKKRNDDSCIIVFAKYPAAGRVKTRLAESIGAEAAADLYKCFVEDGLSGIKDGVLYGVPEGDCRRPVKIFFDPPEARQYFNDWLGDGFTYFAQRGKDLGERMKNAFEDVFESGFKRAVLIGSDIPDLPAGFIDRAISAMAENDVIIGPGSDGGYYLIGFTKDGFVPEAFEKVYWGTDTVLKQTIEVFERNKKPFFLLPEWHDIDTVEDIKAMMLRNRETAFSGSRTCEYYREHIQKSAEVKR